MEQLAFPYLFLKQISGGKNKPLLFVSYRVRKTTVGRSASNFSPQDIDKDTCTNSKRNCIAYFQNMTLARQIRTALRRVHS